MLKKLITFAKSETIDLNTNLNDTVKAKLKLHDTTQTPTCSETSDASFVDNQNEEGGIAANHKIHQEAALNPVQFSGGHNGKSLKKNNTKTASMPNMAKGMLPSPALRDDAAAVPSAGPSSIPAAVPKVISSTITTSEATKEEIASLASATGSSKNRRSRGRRRRNRKMQARKPSMGLPSQITPHTDQNNLKVINLNQEHGERARRSLSKKIPQ